MPSPRPRLLILPGIDGRPELRDGIENALTGRVEVHIAALPEDRDLDYPALARHFADRLPAGPLVLAGESFSGPLAALIAEKCPETMLGVALSRRFRDSPFREQPAACWTISRTEPFPSH